MSMRQPFRWNFGLLAIATAGILAAGETPPTWTDVQPLVEKNCTTCHQPGEIAPMSFTSYGEVRPWAAAIKESVLTDKMPPWGASRSSTHPFQNQRSLTTAEKKTITQWVDAGCPPGKAASIAVSRQGNESWKLGKPDRVFTVPGFAVPASGVLPYSFLIIPLHFEQDTWVRAAEFRMEQRGVIHHINAFVRPPGSSYLTDFPREKVFVPTVAERGKRRAEERVFDRRELLLGYEPGYRPMPWLEGGAKLIRAGSDLVFEMHYNPNGTAVTDHSQLALYFSPGPPAKRVIAIDTLRDIDLTIAPEDADSRSEASMVLGQPVRLLSIQPHMHVRGKSMRVEAISSDGVHDLLLDVPHYDFGWQTTYVLQDPLTLPAGTRLLSDAVFDNSRNNPFNPDAKATVHWGDQTTDEMHIAFLELAIDAKADPETLLKEKPKAIGQTQSAKK